MKKILFFCLIFFFSFSFVEAQENRLFYYHEDGKIYLDIVGNVKIVHFNKAIEASQKEYICKDS